MNLTRFECFEGSCFPGVPGLDGSGAGETSRRSRLLDREMIRPCPDCSQPVLFPRPCHAFSTCAHPLSLQDSIVSLLDRPQTAEVR